MKVLFAVLVALFGAANSYAETTDLKPVVIEASRSDDALIDMNKDVTIITAEQIANSPSKSLPELLGMQSGVQGFQYGSPKNSIVDIHGFGESSPSNVLVLVDGRRTNEIDLSGVDWTQIDLNSIQRVEIIKGSGTVLYGDNAVGGVINIITKKGKKDTKPSVSLINEFGSYQTQKHAFELSGGLHTLDYQFNYAHNETTGYRANSDYWANDFNTHLGYDPTDVFGIDFSQGYHLDRYQSPGALFISTIDQVGRQGVRSDLAYDHGWTSDSNFTLTPHLKFNMGTSDGEFSMLTSERRRGTKAIDFTDTYLVHSLINSYEFQPKVVISTPISDRLNNKVTGGYDYFYGKNFNESGSIAGAFAGPVPQVFVSKVTHGVYALDEVALDDRWLANIGARGTWAHYGFNEMTVIPGKTQRSSTVEGYDGGLGYKYNPNSKVYVNYTRSYRLPDTDEFFQDPFSGVLPMGSGGGFNPDLGPQKGNQYSWGIKDNTFKDIHLGLNFFADQYKNEIYFNPAVFTNVNYDGRTRHDGVEGDASIDLLEGRLTPFINLTFQQARFRNGSFNDNDIPLIPNEMANVGATWRPLKGLSTTLTINQVGKRFALSDQTNTHTKLKRYATADWSIKYGYKNIEVWFGINNITKAKYSTYGGVSGSQVGYYPAPERNVSAGVKLKF